MTKDNSEFKKDNKKNNKDSTNIEDTKEIEQNTKEIGQNTNIIESTADASISVIQENPQQLQIMNPDTSTNNKKRVKSEIDLIKEEIEEDILEFGIASTDLIEEIDRNVVERLNKTEPLNVYDPETTKKETHQEIYQEKYNEKYQDKYNEIITNRESNQKRRESIRESIKERRNSLIGKIYNKIEIVDKNRLLNFNTNETDDLKKIKDPQIHTQRSINFKAAFTKIINELSLTVNQINEKLVNIKLNQDSYSMTVESSHFDSLLNGDDNKKIKFENLEKILKKVFKDLCIKYDVINSLDNLENKTVNYEDGDETTLNSNELTREILESHYGDYKKLLFEKIKETDCTQIEARNKFLNEKIIKEKQKYEYNKSVLEDLLKSINDSL